MKHFHRNEFDSPDNPGSGSAMHSETLEMLDRARELAGLPFVITSGYRTPDHNESVGGVDESAHTRGYAADISIKDMDDGDVTKVIAACSIAGFRRIGKADSFIHVDNDPEKPGGNGLVTWGYNDE